MGLLSPADGPGARGPAGHVEVQLGHLARVARLAVVSDRPGPGIGCDRGDRRAELGVRPGIHGELDVAGRQADHEGTHRTGAVGADHDPVGNAVGVVAIAVADPPCFGQRGDSGIDDGQLVGPAVGRGVARSQQAGEGLAGGIGEAQHGMKAVPALVVAGGGLLVGRVDLDQGGVDVEDRLVLGRDELPHPLPGAGAGPAQGVGHLGVDLVHGPPDRRRRPA